LALIESNHKKATFLREVARSLTLTNIDIQNARAELLPATHQFYLVTLRAVERFHDILPIAASRVAPTGHLALLIGQSQSETAIKTLPTFQWKHPMPIPCSEARVLLIGENVALDS